MAFDKNCVVLAPFNITNDMLISGPPDAENQVYNGGTTYDKGDQVWYSGHAWESLVDSNTGNTPVEGANWTDLGQVDEGANVWASGTTYAEGDWAVYQGQLWRSTVGSNTGNTPTATATQWQTYGATNRLRAFDLYLNKSSALGGTLKWTIDLTERANSIMVLAPFGASVSLVATTGGTEVYNVTESITAPVSSYYDYHWAPFDRKYAIVRDDFPAFRNVDLTVTITGATTRCGQIVIGYGDAVGVVVTGSGVGFEGFGSVEFDAFGNPSFPVNVQQRITSFAIRNWIKDTGRTNRIMSRRIQQPTGVFMRDGEDYGLVAFGVLKGFFTNFSNPTVSENVIEVDGFAEGDAL